MKFKIKTAAWILTGWKEKKRMNPYLNVLILKTWSLFHAVPNRLFDHQGNKDDGH
jgi:hypothetical protein